MISPPSFTVPIVLRGRTVTGRDTYGNDVRADTSTTVQGVYAPGGSSEVTGDRDTVTTQPTVYLPASVSLAAVDAVEIGGVTFEVDGEPQRWDLQPHPFGGSVPPFPIVAQLRKVTG